MKAAAICVVFDKTRSKLLLVRRKDIPVWVLPGGGIDERESPEQAAIRETLEETGLQVKILRKIGTYHPMNRLASTTHVFEADVVDGTIQKGNESKAVDFYMLNKLPKGFFFLHNIWLKDALNKENHDKVLNKNITQVNYWELIKFFLKHPWIVFRLLLTRLGFESR